MLYACCTAAAAVSLPREKYCDGDALEASKEQDPYYAAGCYRHFHFGAQLVV